MPYPVISNFKLGLDKRRSELSTQPGVLEELSNAFVNEGAEIEKRKTFARTALVVPTNGQFGFQPLGNSIYVFGTVVDPGGWPSGIAYQKLNLSPTAITPLTITRIVWSTVYDSRIVVLALMSDAKIHMFYDGFEVADHYEGTGLNDPTLLAPQLVNALSSIPGLNGSYPGGGVALATVTNEANYGISIVETSTLGTLTVQQTRLTIPGKPGAVAIGSFKILAGSEAGGNQITQIAVGADNLFTGGASGVVPFNDSPEQTALDVAVSINAGTSIYSARSEGAVVQILADSSGPTPNGKDVIVTAAGNVCVGACIFSLSGTDFKVNYIRVDGVNILTAVFDFPQAAGQTLTAFCAAIVTDINANTSAGLTHGYLAFSSQNVIYLSKAVTSSANGILNVEVDVTPDVGGTGGGTPGTEKPLLIRLNRSSVIFTLTDQGSQQRPAVYTSDYATVEVSGGVPPYTFSWVILPLAPGVAQTPGIPVAVAPTAQSTNFIVTHYRGVDWGGFFRPNREFVCKVTDALNASGESGPLIVPVP